MRIHSNTITRTQLFDAANSAGMRLFSVTDHGSRKRGHAFEVKGSGSSPYRTQGDKYEYAATWDEWGIFIRALFAIDQDAIIGTYDGMAKFSAFSGGYFDGLTPSEQHKRHKWEYNGFGHECECGAVANYSVIRNR